MIGDTGVQSAWQENTMGGEHETACESQNRSSYLPRFLPSRVHAGVTDVVAKREPELPLEPPGERSLW